MRLGSSGESWSPGRSTKALDLPSAEFRPKASRTRFRNATRHAPSKVQFRGEYDAVKGLNMRMRSVHMSGVSNPHAAKTKGFSFFGLSSVLCTRDSLPPRLFALPALVAFARLSPLFKKIKPQVAAAAAAAVAATEVIQPC